MAGFFSLFMRSEERVRVVLGYLLLALLPPFVALTVMAGKFQGLRDPATADRAQVAVHLAAGKGFTTDFIRPLSRVFVPDPDLANHPDLYNAPVYPIVEAVVFWV